MKEGKQKCRILKTIRKQIAEANDIKLVHLNVDIGEIA